ncbi:hypothetical protein TNCV_865801 [Trichonephila clavipes]|nr:hypothetical protein TNCV_865801 [Trichonephila clavipes]
MVDVVGRLGNASRREPTLAYGVSPTLETGFGKTCGMLASESFGPWNALWRHVPRAYIRASKQNLSLSATCGVNPPILLMATCFITRARQCPSNSPLPLFPSMALIPK